jgi:translation initiation factor IF-3
MTPRIDAHDLQVKASNAIKFLKAENKVKVTVRFRGRELGHTNIGRDVLKKFVEMISEYGEVEKHPRMEGRNMVMFLSPKK